MSNKHHYVNDNLRITAVWSNLHDMWFYVLEKKRKFLFRTSWWDTGVTWSFRTPGLTFEDCKNTLIERYQKTQIDPFE